MQGKSKRNQKRAKARKKSKCKVRLEPLENRAMLTTFVVNSIGDDASGVADGHLTLREAIVASNTNAAFGDAPAGMAHGDRIRFDLPGHATVLLKNGEFEIKDDVMIDGDGRVTLDAQHVSRIFNVSTNQNIGLHGLSLTNGAAADGGAIYNGGGGTLEVRDSMITHSVANGPSGSGGGIFNAESGRLTVRDTSIVGNTANRAGGGIEDASNVSGVVGLTLRNVRLDGNNAGVSPATASPGNGGGLHVTGAGDVRIFGGSANNNVAAREGGGLWSGSGLMTVDGTEIKHNVASGPAADDGGGGIFNNGGTVSIRNSTVSENVADGTSGSGGGIFNAIGGKVWIRDSAITSNTANRAGGGIEDASNVAGVYGLTMHNVILDGNNAGVSPANATPGNGGGLHVTGAGNVWIVGGSANDNVAAREGGGLWNGTGLMFVDNMTIMDNVASGPAADDGGGGIFNNGGDLTLRRVTVTGNVADGSSGSGGGIFSTAGKLQLNRSDISNNTANRAGGGIEIVDGSLKFYQSKMNENVAGPEGMAAPGNGGGLHVTGKDTHVTIERSHVIGNTAALEGGGLWNQSGQSLMIVHRSHVTDNVALGDGADDGGGGIFNNGGHLVVSKSDILHNLATGTSGSGGGILSLDGDVEISNSEVNRNTANRAGGGVEIVDGELQVIRSELNHNVAGPAGSASPGNGGAVHVTGKDARVAIRRTEVKGNFAAREGGGLWNQVGSRMIVDRSVVRDNVAAGDAADDGGGGIFNNGGDLVLKWSRVTKNIANGDSGSGGGLFSTDGSVEIVHSTLSRNVANRAGGGIEIVDGNLQLTRVFLTHNVAGPTGMASPGNGGALHVTGREATVNVIRSYVGANIAASEGGGLWNQVGSTMNVKSSYFFRNSAFGTSADNGGGALFNNGGILNVESSTARRNSAKTSGGGIFTTAGGVTNVKRSVIADNSPDDFAGLGELNRD